MKRIRTENKPVTVVASLLLALAGVFVAGCVAEAGDSQVDEDTAPAAQASTGVSSQLARGEQLAPGALLKSPDGRLVFVMQSDGNLVLYFSPFGTWQEALWASNTGGHPGAWAIMQDDGNFVVYDANGAPLWATATGPSGNSIVVQSDGNVVVYDANGAPRWSSNTAPNVPPASMCLSQPSYNAYFCPAGSWWRSCDAPTYNPYAAFVDGNSSIVVKCDEKCGTGCLHRGQHANNVCQGTSLNVRICSNDDGVLVCTPSTSC